MIKILQRKITILSPSPNIITFVVIVTLSCMHRTGIEPKLLDCYHRTNHLRQPSSEVDGRFNFRIKRMCAQIYETQT